MSTGTLSHNLKRLKTKCIKAQHIGEYQFKTLNPTHLTPMQLIWLRLIENIKKSLKTTINETFFLLVYADAFSHRVIIINVQNKTLRDLSRRKIYINYVLISETN